jgi:hypothetical protein
MFEQKDALPGTELHLAIDNRDGLAGPGQDHANMRSAVVAAFGGVDKVIGIFRDKPFKKFFQVAPRGWIGILHHDKAATGVLDEDCGGATAHIALVDLILNLISDFVGAFAAGANFDLCVVQAHKTSVPTGSKLEPAVALLFRRQCARGILKLLRPLLAARLQGAVPPLQ